MPSTESTALREHFHAMATRLADHPDLGLEGMRDMIDQLARRQKEPVDVTYEEVTAGDRPAIWARPLDTDGDQVILYTHGGGYIGFTADTDRKLIGHLARSAGAHALTPDYRQAPEHPFPAQLQDAVAAYRWLLDQGHQAQRIAIAGESAGGNLALATVLQLRHQGLPLPAAVVGFSPWLDLDGTGSTFDTNAQSDAFLSREVNNMMAGLFLNGVSPKDPMANPALADPTGLPPLYLTAGSDETLMASIRTYADEARAAGVDVTLEVAEGQQHAFVWMAGRTPEADATIDRVGHWLQDKLKGTA